MFRSGFLPISSEVELAEVGVVRVALVSMGEHIGLLDNWYTLPDEGNKVCSDYTGLCRTEIACKI